MNEPGIEWKDKEILDLFVSMDPNEKDEIISLAQSLLAVRE